MPTNCSICGGLIKLTTWDYAEQDAPVLFQLVTTCEDCGRSSRYDCVKPSPEKFIEPKDPSVLREGEPDTTKFDPSKYDAIMDKLHKRPLREAQEYINRRLTPDTDNVIPFTGVTRHDVPVETIMAHLLSLDIMEIVAVGFLNDGSEFFSSSKSDGAAALWHLSRAQHKLMTYADLEEGE